MQYTIRHETRCHFDSPASYSIRNLRITPREEAGLRVTNWHVSTPARSRRSVDAWGNTTHLLTLTEPHEEVRIVVTGVVDVPDNANAILGREGSTIAPEIFLATTRLTEPGAELIAFALSCLAPPQHTIPGVLACLEHLRQVVRPAPSSGDALRGAVASFDRHSANLPDTVHLLLAICRAAGLPARFVSGYQLVDKPSEYAWADVWLEDAGGWVSFDVRRARLANGCQVRLAVGRDYLDACPMRAAHQGGGHEEVRVTVSTSS